MSLFLAVACGTVDDGFQLEATSLYDGSSAPLSTFGTTITHLPNPLPAQPMPLVVALHGCTQSAAEYQTATEWNKLADRYGFAVVYPHKTNGGIMNCWDHAATGTGSPATDMAHVLGVIDAISAAQAIDSSRIYVTGLSAGGGLTYCLMEQHGDRFAGAAPMAAPQCGEKGSPQSESMLIWHSPSDSYSQGTAGFARFGGLYSGAQKTIVGSTLKPNNSTHTYDAYTMNGAAVVGLVTTSMKHGIAVEPGSAEDQGGVTGTYATDRDIFSSYYTAKFWGLLQSAPANALHVNITAPVTEAVITTDVVIEAAAESQPLAVAKVEFYINGTLRGADSVAPYSFFWPAMSEANGRYALMVKAYDEAGGVAIDNDTVVSVQGEVIDTVPPSVNITAPANGSTVTGKVVITATATDAGSGIGTVDFYVDDVLVGSDSGAPFQVEWDTASTAVGNHQISAVATDGAGNTAGDADTTITIAAAVACYSETATSNLSSHLVAKRINSSQFVALGSKYGYMAQVTLYHLTAAYGSGWVDVTGLPASCAVN